ncbi:MAG TPA: lysophospholipid acyltransferase family protein, partial [Gemmata sp.]|nr:lysophospholipid acyltransferase family protein [Gemmata sp.]
MASTAIESPHDRLTGPTTLPRRWFWLMRFFCWYGRRYVRKHFHAVRLAKSGHPFPPDSREPLLVVLNHPSWWDPMICLVLSRMMADRDQFAAIDAEAVKRYSFFKKIGFIPVDTKSLRGAAEFVRTAAAILSRSGRVYWVTAQGRFTDVRERPLAINSGVGHLAARLAEGIILPVALEYTFWTESTPEALVRFGEPLAVTEHPGLIGKEWTVLIEVAMTNKRLGSAF